MTMLEDYDNQGQQRGNLGIPSVPLGAKQTSELCKLLKSPPVETQKKLIALLRDREMGRHSQKYIVERQKSKNIVFLVLYQNPPDIKTVELMLVN